MPALAPTTFGCPRFAPSAFPHPPLTERLSLDHPGYVEGIVVSGARQFASVTMSVALALALGGGHYAVAAVAAIPFVARLSHLWVPELIRRYGSWTVARAGFRLERCGFLFAAVIGIVRPTSWAVPGCLAGLAVAFLGQAFYDASMSALHSEVAAAGEFGNYTAIKTRWASLSGLAFGLLASGAVDWTERIGLSAAIARGGAIVAGIAVHTLLARPFFRMGVIARRHAHLIPPEPAALTRPAAGLRALGPRTAEERAVVWLALAWGTAYGIGNRQGEAMAMSLLGVPVGAIVLLNAVLVGAGILGARTWGRLADRFGGRGLMALALVAFAIDPLWNLLGMVVHPWLLVPGYVVWGIFNTGFAIAQTFVLVRTTGHPADRIRALTIYNVVYGVAAGLSPFVGGALLTALDGPLSSQAAYTVLFLVTAVLRGLTIPVLRHLPGQAASARHVSAVYFRAMRRAVPLQTRRLSRRLRPRAAANPPGELLPLYRVTGEWPAVGK
ncbi:MAG: hypothetical protein NVS4B3_00400 [Gemmatimonadaceae bacterium]